MSKKFVLDTNVLLHDPRSIYAFEDNDVVIILSVLGEVDTFKKSPGELGANSREVARQLDKLSRGKDLMNGVDLPNGGRLFVYHYHYMKLTINHEESVDSKILAEAKYLREQGETAIVVSKDVILRVMANGLGITAEDYETDAKQMKQYTGVRGVQVLQSTLDGFATSGRLVLDDVESCPNEFIQLSTIDTGKSMLGIVGADRKTVSRIRDSGLYAMNIKPRNLEQCFAMHALLDDSIKLVTLQGCAGTGKTLLAVAAGMSKYEEETYAKIVITRPVIPVGRDLGFLPGDIDEKMLPWMMPIYDAIDMIRENDRKSQKSQISSSFSPEKDLQVAPLTYVRGRSIPHSFMIVDEAQNLTPLEVKTLVTRCGEGTKMVFTGDTDQIDNPFLDSMSNGFSFLISRFKENALHAHVQLKRGERSALAEAGAEIL